MTSSELAEAGVLGLEDHNVPAEPETFSEQRSDETGSASEVEDSDEDRRCPEAASVADAFNSRPDLLIELRKVHVLDELIMEENLKIHELRHCNENSEEEISDTNPSDTNQSSSLGEERQGFRLQLEKEKKEVEKLEKSLDKEHKVKKHKDQARKVIRCSIMEEARTENEEDRALCDELLSGSTHSTLVDQNDSQVQDSCQTESIPAESSSDAAKDAVDQLEDDKNKNCNLEEPDSASKQSSCNEMRLNSDSEEPSAELGIQPQGLVDIPSKNAAVCSLECSLAPEMKPGDGAFDPGGGPALYKASLPVSNDVTEHELPHSTELMNDALSSADPTSIHLNVQEPNTLLETPADAHGLILNPNVKEHSNNNNNKNLLLVCEASLDHHSSNSSDITAEEELAVCTDGLHTDETSAPPVEEISAPQSPPDCPLEFDPGGDEYKEDLSDGLQISEDTRMSGSGMQAQLNINMTQITNFKTPIVLDTGSGLMKAGFADQDLPSVIFPTIIGLPKYEEIMNGSAEREAYIGHEAQHMRGVLTLKHPIKNGIIRNWDDMEKIWNHTFQQLSVDPEEHPVLLTEAAMNPLENRQRMVEIMFECFGVPFTYVAMQAVLALYAAGKTTGVVFDSGDGVSHSVPVYDGYCLPHAVQRFPLAGVDVTMHLKKLLQEQGVSMRTTAELEIVREMKERCCCVALNYERELSRGGPSCGEMHYTMPDGQIVSLSTERFRAPEILFKPELIGRDHYGMHESIFKSILSSDIDLRRCFLGNIVLSGGNTLLSGLPERLQAEIRGLVGPDLGDGVRVSSPRDRDFSVWSGGAVLANMPRLSSAWISQDEYDEFGPQIVFRKCF